jgi:hypothetical protein
MHANDHASIEITKEMEDEWMDMIDRFTSYSGFVKDSFFMGGNIPGKPIAILQNPGGRRQMMDFFAKSKDNGHQGFTLDGRVADTRPV